MTAPPQPAVETPHDPTGDAVSSVSSDRRRPRCLGDDSGDVTARERLRRTVAEESDVPNEAVRTVSGPSSVPCPGVPLPVAGVGRIATPAGLADSLRPGLPKAVVAGLLTVVAIVAESHGSATRLWRLVPNLGEER